MLLREEKGGADADNRGRGASCVAATGTGWVSPASLAAEPGALGSCVLGSIPGVNARLEPAGLLTLAGA
jgi:hypothetical protein